MRNRLGVLSLCIAALCLTACSSGSSFNTADLNPFSNNCCEPAPDPCAPCQPAPAPCAAPVAQVQPCDPCATNSGQRPPDARPGEVWCYVRVPAITKTVCEQVCVQPERCDKVWVEPVTKEVCEQVCTCPEQVQCRTIPAEFEDVCEQICTAPARNEWRKVDCQAKESLKPQEQIGECWTLVEIPPCYENRTKRVCTCPEKTVQDVIPAKYESRTRTVTVTPGYYKNVPVPAQYETRTKEVVVCGPRWEWRRTTECEVPGVVGVVQPQAPYAGAGNELPPLDTPAPYELDPLDPLGDAPAAGELPPLDPLDPLGR